MEEEYTQRWCQTKYEVSFNMRDVVVALERCLQRFSLELFVACLDFLFCMHGIPLSYPTLKKIVFLSNELIIMV